MGRGEELVDFEHRESKLPNRLPAYSAIRTRSVVFSLIYLGLESAYAQKHMFCLGSYMVVHEHLSRVSGMHNLNALRTHALSQVLHLPSMTDPKPTGLLAFLEL